MSCSKLPNNMIKSMLSDFNDLMMEKRKTWNTNKFQLKNGKKYELTTKCEVCGSISIDQTGKVRHHQWC